MILVVQNLRNNLIHPNEYISGVTLRFVCRLAEDEILEPLVPSILACLDHRKHFVRRYAVLAMDHIAGLPHGEVLLPDADEVVAALLEMEEVRKR